MATLVRIKQTIVMMLNAATFETLKQWICALRDPLTFQKKMEMLDCEMQEHKDLQS
jgi:hypothetical protein